MRERRKKVQQGKPPARSLRPRDGFSLVELLVVIGIIATLIGILMPALSRARDRANCAVCASNLQQIGLCLMMYANENQGWLFPVGPVDMINPDYTAGFSSQKYIPETLGTNVDPQYRWPVYVFQPPVYNPSIMICPSDFNPAPTQPPPVLPGVGGYAGGEGGHSYVVNQHLADHLITNNQAWSPDALGGLYNSQVVVLGEKVTDQPDYYMEMDDFNRVVEPYRHGTAYGSNYLYLDMHVTTDAPSAVEGLSGMDPWDPPIVANSAGSGSGT